MKTIQNKIKVVSETEEKLLKIIQNGIETLPQTRIFKTQ